MLEGNKLNSERFTKSMKGCVDLYRIYHHLTYCFDIFQTIWKKE